MKADWKSITTELGEQSATITLTISMLVLSAIVLDTGSCWCYFFVTKRTQRCIAI